MSTLNYATKEISCKIVYYGAALCGKTTNLQQVFKSMPADSRGELVSLDTDQDRTLYFDFLPLDLGQVQGLRTKFQLYTVPGQVYYNATRKLVLRGVDGVVLVVDSQASRLDENLESLANLQENLTSYGYCMDEMPFVIQYNKRDLSDAMPIEELQQRLNSMGAPFSEASAFEGQGVKETLKLISGKVLEKLSNSGGFRSAPPAAQKSDAPKRPSLGVVRAVAPSTPRPARSAPRLPRVNSPVPVTGRGKSDERLEMAGGPGRLAVKQRCDVYWRGIKVGTASLELTSVGAGKAGENYHLSESSRILMLLRKKRFHSIKFQREQDDEAARSGAHYRFGAGGAADAEDGLQVWLRKGGRQSLFVRRQGLGGHILYAPAGQFAEAVALESQTQQNPNGKGTVQ